MSDKRQLGEIFLDRRSTSSSRRQSNNNVRSSLPILPPFPSSATTTTSLRQSLLEIQQEQEKESILRRKEVEAQNRLHHQQQRTTRYSVRKEEGAISKLLDSYGFIECAEREEEIFFHFSDLMHKTDFNFLREGDEVEFEVGMSKNKPAAFRVKLLPPGSVEWEIRDNERRFGEVDRPVRGFPSGSAGGAVSSQIYQGTIRFKNDEEGAEFSGKGPLVRFTLEDYQAVKGQSSRLQRGDLVEFSLVTERRTSKKFARNIVLIQSAKEKKMLEEATSERGVIVSMKDDYGFLRSTSRREHIYFNFSHLKDEVSSFFEGQCAEFLVVKEEHENGRSDTFSAREVRSLPNGSVEFRRIVAHGISGVILIIPSRKNSSRRHSKPGKVRLSTPLVVEGEEVSDVALYIEDLPGVISSRDTSQAILMVKEGDIILFDLAIEVVDGTLCVSPTSYHQPSQDAPQEVEDGQKKVRLLQLSQNGRSEGVVNVLKDGFGFISCVDRNVDLYFRFQDVFPKSIQDNFLEGAELKVGAEVSYDLVSNSKNGKQQENDNNCKAQRILILPEGSVQFEINLATGVKAIVNQIHNDGSGFIELEEPLTNAQDTDVPKSTKRKKPKLIKLVRFDKHAFREDASLGDVVSCDVIYVRRTGLYAAIHLKILIRNKRCEALKGFRLKGNKNTCLGFIVMEPTALMPYSSQGNTLTSASGRWGNIKEEKANEVSNMSNGCIILLDDPCSTFTQETKPQPKDEHEAPTDTAMPTSYGIYLSYHNDRGRSSHDHPRRGDLVSFTKGKTPNTVKDLKLAKKSLAERVTGRLTEIDSHKQSAKFQVDRNCFVKDLSDHYFVGFRDILGLDPNSLKDNVLVEGILVEGTIIGVCRKKELYLDNTKIFGISKKERKPLNLTVRKDLGGKIIAQSCMAKGPNGTRGFQPGWTKRVSIFAETKKDDQVPASSSDTVEVVSVPTSLQKQLSEK